MLNLKKIFRKSRSKVIYLQENVSPSAKGTLYFSVRWILIIFRAVGLFPLQGLGHSTEDRLVFNWLSLCMLRYTGCLLGVILLNLLVLNEIYNNGLQYYQINITIIVSSSLWTTLIMLKITRNWPRVTRSADELLAKVPASDTDVRRHCIYGALGLLFLGLSDYAIYTTHAIHSTAVCHEHMPAMLAYYTLYHSWIFNYIPFNYWFGAVYQIVELLTVFILYFKDIVVVVCSIYAYQLFNKLNQLIMRNENRPPWKDLQSHYTKISLLVEMLDKEISSLVFLSHLCNMYYICNELFALLHDAYSPGKTKCYSGNIIVEIEAIFFHGYALFAMVTRAMVATLLPAKVYTSSKAALELLHILPASKYNLEIQHFVDQIYNSNVGFTGLGFFYVTREIMLSMVATIITYELVLLQFHDL